MLAKFDVGTEVIRKVIDPGLLARWTQGPGAWQRSTVRDHTEKQNNLQELVEVWEIEKANEETCSEGIYLCSYTKRER